MNDRQLILKTAEWLQDRWGVVLPENSAEYDQREELIRFLIPRLKYFLEHEFEFLVNTMYRLDVSEAKFHQALAGKDTDQIAGQLAEIVLDREIQRMETRIRYSQNNSTKD
ncbi:MAG: hypothetical protein H6581_07355 [Bacteroidia bacterium]|nr:hypothetical protein [Bacteroidia bacterium]